MSCRVLYVINSLRVGGAEKLVADILPRLQEKGFKVDLLVLDNEETTLEVYLRGEGVTVLKSYNSSVYNPFHIVRIFSLLNKYGLIHVHLFPALYWTRIAKFVSKARSILVYTEHSTSNKRRDRRIFKVIDNLIYNGYRRIVTISDDVDSRLKAHLDLPDSRFILIHNGIDLERIDRASPSKDILLRKEVHEKFILQVSSFRWPKDHKTLIKALPLLPKSIKLLLVGDGPLMKECKEFALKLDVYNRVEFLGVRTDVPELLKVADIVVLSSNYEGLSLASIEGMASGRPFIASDVPGLADIVRGAGLLFPKGNYNELVKHIKELLSDSNYYKRITSKCLARSKKYSIETTVDSHAILYKELLNRSI